MSSYLSDAEYEAVTLAYWQQRKAEADEITITVRSHGKVIQFVMLRPDCQSVVMNPSDYHESLSGG